MQNNKSHQKQTFHSMATSGHTKINQLNKNKTKGKNKNNTQ